MQWKTVLTDISSLISRVEAALNRTKVGQLESNSAVVRIVLGDAIFWGLEFNARRRKGGGVR